jgi:hypothetical protein
MASFTAYCDESYIGGGNRFRGVAAVSLPTSVEAVLTGQVQAILSDSNVREFKWSEFADAKRRFAASKLLHWATAATSASLLRVDVLMFDTEDSRHRIAARDDDANYERMVFHLLTTTLQKRGSGTEWRVYPDEKVGVHWSTINDCVQAVGNRVAGGSPGLFADCAEFMRTGRYSVRRFEPVRSEEHPLVQVADLFCGLGVYSRLRYDAYSAWLPSVDRQMTLCPPLNAVPAPSQTDQERFQVLREFKDVLEAGRFGVSLKSTRGLRTHRPSQPLNFWWYEPQHNRDRAPVKTTARWAASRWHALSPRKR